MTTRKMTTEEAIETIETAIAEVEWEYPMQYAEAFEMAIKALKGMDINVPGKNTIYRQDAINALCKEGCGSRYCGIACVEVKAIEQLPSAQPDIARDIATIIENEKDMRVILSGAERPKGKWIDAWRSKMDGTRYWYRECDHCGYERDDCDPEKDSNFCPNCGAQMRVNRNE